MKRKRQRRNLEKDNDDEVDEDEEGDINNSDNEEEEEENDEDIDEENDDSDNDDEYNLCQGIPESITYKYSRNYVFPQSYCANFEGICKKYGALLQHQSNRELPRTNFNSSYLSIAKKMVTKWLDFCLYTFRSLPLMKIPMYF